MSTCNGELYFAPDVLWSDVQIGNGRAFRNQLCLRFRGLYFEPARYLIEKVEPDHFAAGLLVLSALDAIARLWVDDPTIVAVRFKTTFDKFAPSVLGEFQKQWATVVYDNFRNGLVHEARVKLGARFDLNAESCIKETDGICVINPRCLLSIAEAALDGLVSDDNAERFRAKTIPRLQEDGPGSISM